MHHDAWSNGLLVWTDADAETPGLVEKMSGKCNR